MKVKVLFVDDEPKLLEGLRRNLRPLRNEWETRFASSGHEALMILAESPYDVIVTDMRMPVLDGAGLLKEVAQRHPDILRVVLSGQSDMESVVKASGVAHQYLAKPCPLDALKEAIRHAFAVNEKLRNAQLRSLISGIDALPSLPRSYSELTAALDSPDSSAAVIGQIISRDIAMSSKVLQMMNSAFFGRSRRVSDPAEAVNYLGTAAIRALAIAVHAFRCFESGELGGPAAQELWEHSIACSNLADRIAKDLFPGNKELHDQARTAGLLHDIGRLVVACKLPERSAEIEEKAAAGRMSLWEAECQILGVSHAEIGAHLLAFWGLPAPIVEAVSFHHYPGECHTEDSRTLALVHLANGLLRENAAAGYGTPIDQKYLSHAGLDQHPAAARLRWMDSTGEAA